MLGQNTEDGVGVVRSSNGWLADRSFSRQFFEVYPHENQHLDNKEYVRIQRNLNLVEGLDVSPSKGMGDVGRLAVSIEEIKKNEREG
jgi:hypothetical protein